MRTWLRLASLAVVLGVAGYAISRAAARDASTLASIDPAVFADAAKDAQPPAAVIAPAYGEPELFATSATRLSSIFR